jgi:Helix-turn-helix of DDE superfamily endonuclease
LAHLRNGDTLTRLACGFQIGVATAWRYVREAVDLLAATADDLDAVMARIRVLAYAILDGTLVPIDRVADQKPYYSGEHGRHGVNAQVIADPGREAVLQSWQKAHAELLNTPVKTIALARHHGAVGPVANPGLGARGALGVGCERSG